MALGLRGNLQKIALCRYNLKVTLRHVPETTLGQVVGRQEKCQGWHYLTSRASGTGGGLRVCPTSIRVYSGSTNLFQISFHYK